MRKGDDKLLVAIVDVAKEKLLENQHKEPISEMNLNEAINGLRVELKELLEELEKDPWDFAAIRRELGDVINYAGAGVVACDRTLFISNMLMVKE